MLAALLLVALLTFAAPSNSPAPAQEEPPEVVEVTDMTDVEAPKKGWYKNSGNGWSYWGGEDDPAIDAVQSPPKVTASMNADWSKTAGGFAIFAALIAFAKWLSGKGKKEREPVRGGVSQAQWLAMLRRVNDMASIMESVAPDGNGAKATERR